MTFELVFKTSNPFYHLQKNSDGTSIQGRDMGRTSGGLGCQEGGYIKGKEEKRKVNSVLLDIN